MIAGHLWFSVLPCIIVSILPIYHSAYSWTMGGRQFGTLRRLPSAELSSLYEIPLRPTIKKHQTNQQTNNPSRPIGFDDTQALVPIQDVDHDHVFLVMGECNQF